MKEHYFDFTRNMSTDAAGQALGAVSSGSAVVGTNVAYNSISPKNVWGVAKALEIGGLYFNIEVKTALVGAGAAVRADLVTKASASISAGATVLASITIPAVSAAKFAKRIQLAPGTECLAYTGVLFYASGANLTSGTVHADLGPSGPTID